MEIIALWEVFKISFYAFGFTPIYSSYRFLYKYELANELIPYYAILKHVLLNGKIQHYKLLLINSQIFDVKNLMILTMIIQI